MKRIGLFLSAVLVVWGCAKEQTQDVTGKLLVASDQGGMVTLQQLAAQLPGLLGDNVRTKSNGAQTVTDIIPFREIAESLAQRSAPSNSVQPAALTRSTVEGDLLDDIYVVNYGYDEGFAILSSDARLPSVFGYSDTGSLTTETDPNPGLKIVLEAIPFTVQMLRDSMPQEDYRYVSRPDLTQTVARVNPLLTTKWWQYSPFNENLPNGGCLLGKYPVGCVSIAMAQIMTYHGYPAVVGGVTHNWAQYRNYTKAEDIPYSAVSALAALGGDIAQNVIVTYSCDGSGSTIQKARSGFIKYGYTGGIIANYSFGVVKEDLNESLPLFMSGVDLQNNGHAWVIDGYVELAKYAEEWLDTKDMDGNLISSEYRGIVSSAPDWLVHCNWGWNGLADGYFNSHLLKTSAGVDYDQSSTTLPNYHYAYALKLIKNLRKAVSPSRTNKITLTGGVPNWTLSAAYPVASDITVSCSSTDTMGKFYYNLYNGQTSLSFSCDYDLNIFSVSPASDETYKYDY